MELHPPAPTTIDSDTGTKQSPTERVLRLSAPTVVVRVIRSTKVFRLIAYRSRDIYLCCPACLGSSPEYEWPR